MIHRTELRIEWAYPSSAHAVKFGSPKKGCWCVERVLWTPIPQLPTALRGFENKADAVIYAQALSKTLENIIDTQSTP